MSARASTGMIAIAIAIASSACATGGASGLGRVSEAERLRASLSGRDAQVLAPQAFAAADEELALARRAWSAGDATGAELYAERALAAYSRAVAVARLARATQEEESARAALARATEEAERYAAQRKATDREADDLEKQLRVAREAQLPLPSGTADPERERARVIATQTLVAQARLLCGAARLVSPQAPGLPEADATLVTLEKQVETAKSPAPIDPAARARAACLSSLTKARRAASADGDPSDALLAELSRAASALTPSRDERGVVVTLRSVFKGDALAADAENTVKDLGRVAAAHPSFGVQVVLHDAQAPNAAETAANQRRGDALLKALVQGGAATAKLKVEHVGARAPVVDPKDARHRERNARVEIVFVSPSG